MAEKKNEESSNPPAATENKVVRERFDFRSLNTLAVVSLASALTSIGAVMAIITGHIALAQIKRSGENGKVLAGTGLALGYLTVAFWIILIVSSVLLRAHVFSDYNGLQPEWFEMNEFRRGFGGMHDR